HPSSCHPSASTPTGRQQQRAWRSSASSVASEEASAGMTHEKEEREEEARWQGGKERWFLTCWKHGHLTSCCDCRVS
ncbi:unnamed protein product, partial [Closterium sp. Naga37s-1]